MSTSLIVDTFEDTSVRRDEGGWFATRTALMIGLTGNPSAIVYNALTDALLTSNNYAFGYVHPTMTALYCSSCAGKAVDRDKVAITSTYRPFQSLYIASASQTGLFSIGASIQSTTTNQDVNGDPLNVAPPGTYSDPQNGTEPNTATANVDVPLVVMTFQRKEPAPSSPTFLAMVGTLNQYSCTIASGSYAAKTLKLDRIQCDPSDNGTTNDYIVRYEFSYRAAGWQAHLVYQNSMGVVVTDTNLPGTADYDIYSTSDFSTLYLW